MSIASEITRLQQAKADIKTAIEGKGVTVPSSATLDSYDGYIDDIEQGGGGDMTNYYTKSETNSLLNAKQDTLVSGTNIKTINNTSVLGNGNIAIPSGKSAYQSYVDTTTDVPVKTEAEWVASLKGADGVDLGEAVLINDLTTGGATNVLSAEMGKRLGEMVGDLIKKYVNLLEDEGTTFLNAYLTYSNGVIGIEDYANGYLAKIPVEPDTCYYVNRSTSWSTNATQTNYVALMDENGVMSLVLNEDGNNGTIALNRLSPNGGVIKTRSDTKYLLIQLGRAAARPKSLVTNEYVLKTDKVVLPAEYYDVQNNVRLNDSVYPYGCKKSLKVLLIGSSYGVNSIMALPPLAASAGIDIVVGNLYQGSVTMAQIASRMNNTDTWTAYGYFDKNGLLYRGDPTINPRVTKNTTYKALQDEAWDVVIIQRSATEAPTAWTAANTTSALTIIDYITANCPSHPKILFNSSFAYPISQFANRTAQQAATDAIIAAAKTARSELGIDIINVARALQLCRDDATINDNADLTNGTVHLNAGIGMYITACCMFETLLSLFGMSVRTQTHIHSAAELKPIFPPAASTQYPIMGDNIATTFTAPTDAQAATIRKYAQMSVKDD